MEDNSIEKSYEKLKEKTVPDFEELIRDQGGFGKYQWMVFLTTVFLINTNGYMIYGLGYLLYLPKFNCWDINPDGSETIIPDYSQRYNDTCKPSYFCNATDIRYEFDFTNDLTLNNWMWKF